MAKILNQKSGSGISYIVQQEISYRKLIKKIKATGKIPVAFCLYYDILIERFKRKPVMGPQFNGKTLALQA